MIILAIETSCDETGVAIIENNNVVSNLTISQIEQQQKYGGVFPGLAGRLHVCNLAKILSIVLLESKIEINSIDYIAFTKEPGMIVCLQIGQIAAQTIGLFLNKKVIGINHLEGHVYSSLINQKKNWIFPVTFLIISGGHSQIGVLFNHNQFNILGNTKDDAIGECLDKVAILLGYKYPGGPVIEKLAEKGFFTYKLPLLRNKNSFDFSFSGLKSEVSRLIIREKEKLRVEDLAFSLQKTLFEILIQKIKLAISKNKSRSFICGGGVISNNYLRNSLLKEINEEFPGLEIFFPEKKYCTDNAAMIGIRAFYKLSIKNI